MDEWDEALGAALAARGNEAVQTLNATGTALNAYQYLAMRTRSPDADLQYMLLKLAEETGELLGTFAKERGQGAKIPTERKLEELGDVLWVVAGIAEAMGYLLEDIGQGNIAKLKRRWPDGFIMGGKP